MMEKEKEQQEFIKKLKKEVDELSFEVNHTKLANFKRSSIKNLKIFKKKLRMFLPFVLVGTMLTGAYAHFVGLPFVKQPVRTYARVKLELDSDSHFNENRQYYNYDDTTSYLYVYSKWQESNNCYSRQIRAYAINENLINSVIDLLESDNPDIESLMLDPTAISYQKSNNLTSEELDRDDYIKATLFYNDKDDQIVRMQYPMEVFQVSGIYVLFLLLTSILVGLIFSDDRKKCYEQIKKIKSEFRNIDLEEVRRQLILKKDNYDRLTRG